MSAPEHDAQQIAQRVIDGLLYVSVDIADIRQWPKHEPITLAVTMEDGEAYLIEVTRG